ncbi:aldolase [Cytobacillus purgationiresistens]|uniref:HPr kinase/phosphorylase C-terminal domain-containing protein n=1 Tax=Cytobacillus purgationiresistens TaxID=863449 RepID=A0ABU0AI33_9BACI|nr:aldolase [Cytobacillus purgationiresistens]MDQ0270916.1 hypothetical protein [Cytobacillus purgationiresistens]
MITKIKTYMYYAFGLHLQSSMPLPELIANNQPLSEVDIQIEENDLTQLWSEYGKRKKFNVIHDHSVLFEVPDTAIYHIEKGNKITVSPIENASLDKIRLFVLGSCMGIILMQRKILPLHGSAVRINNQAYLIVGESGAGKSTLASALLSRGYRLLSDDVIPVSLSDDGTPIVVPAYPQQKLWQSSLDAFGMTADEFRPIYDRESKFAVPVCTQFSSSSLPLAGIFELVKSESDPVQIKSISGLNQLQTLSTHTYRQFLVERLNLVEWHFNMTVKVSQHIHMYRLERPDNQFTAHELAGMIINSINEEQRQ